MQIVRCTGVVLWGGVYDGNVDDEADRLFDLLLVELFYEECLIPERIWVVAASTVQDLLG